MVKPDLHLAGRLLADAEAFGEGMPEDQWAWLLLHHTEVLLQQGRMPQALARVDELRALDRVVAADSPAAQWTARAALLAARIGQRIGDAQLARDGLAEALRRAHDQPRALAEANLYAARIRALFDGPEAAAEVARQAEQQYARLADTAGRERALTERALYFVDAADAARWCAMLDPEPPVLGPVDVGRRLYALAQCHAECGDFARAMVLSRRAAEVLETAGHIVGKAAAMSVHAIAARRNGQFEVAEAVQRELLALRADQGSIALMATTLNNLADVLLCAGRPLEALPLALRSQAAYARMAGGAPEATGSRTLAEILLVLGKWQQAADSVQRSLSGKTGIRMAWSGRTACRVLACAAAGQGRYRDAARLLADPLMTATRFGDMVADEWFPLVRPLPAAILVHPLGVTREVSDGLVVTFPPDAVRQRVAVVLRRLRLRSAAGPGLFVMGWQLAPPGLDLAQPVTVVVPLPPRGDEAAAATLWMRRRPRQPWTLLHRCAGDEPADHAVTVRLPTLGQLAWFSGSPGT
jgi:tetratricopeptide (TPR) repeat protein